MIFCGVVLPTKSSINVKFQIFLSFGFWIISFKKPKKYGFQQFFNKLKIM